MVMIGTDSHKRTHTVVALDEVGRRLGTKTVRTNTEGHLALVEWATQFAEHDEHGVRFALEDCRHGPYPRNLDTGCEYAAVGSVAARRAS